MALWGQLPLPHTLSHLALRLSWELFLLREHRQAQALGQQHRRAVGYQQVQALERGERPGQRWEVGQGAAKVIYCSLSFVLSCTFCTHSQPQCGGQEPHQELHQG